MKISIFTTYTKPEERCDPWEEAINCYESIADEVVITGKSWPKEFKWEYIGQTFQEGFEKTSGDWSIRMDIDYFFHEKDFENLENLLNKYKDYPVLSFPQYQFFTPNRYDLKTRLCVAINNKYKNDIKLNGGGDLCLVTYKNKLITPNKVPSLEIPIYQYDSMFRTKEIIATDRSRFARAWQRQFGNYGNRGGPDNYTAFEAWFKDIEKKYPRHINSMKHENHPSFIKEKLLNIKNDQFGYDAFGLKDRWKYDIQLYLKGKKQKIIDGKLINLTASKLN